MPGLSTWVWRIKVRSSCLHTGTLPILHISKSPDTLTFYPSLLVWMLLMAEKSLPFLGYAIVLDNDGLRSQMSQKAVCKNLGWEVLLAKRHVCFVGPSMWSKSSGTYLSYQGWINPNCLKISETIYVFIKQSTSILLTGLSQSPVSCIGFLEKWIEIEYCCLEKTGLEKGKAKRFWFCVTAEQSL